MSALKRLSDDVFIRNNAIFFISTMAASALSYLFHPVLARLLSIEDYGEIQALLSLYALTAIPLGIFGTIAVNIFANTDDHDHADGLMRRRLISTLRILAMATVAIMFIGLIGSSQKLGSFFRFSTFEPFLVFAFTLAMAVLMLFRRSYLRGVSDFKSLGTAQILETGGRLVFAAALVAIGLRSTGAMLGVVLSQILVYVFIYLKTKRSLTFTESPFKVLGPEIRKELAFGILILAVSLTTTFLHSADVLIVKRFFSPSEAGAYGGISTVARIVLYITGSVTAVLIPSIRLKNPPEENRRMLFKALGISTVLGGSAFLAFAAAPELVIKLLIGERYIGEAWLLPKLSLSMLLIAIASPILAYHLALRRRFIAPIGLSGAALILILCVIDHSSTSAIVDHYILGTSLILAALVAKAVLPGIKSGNYARI